jgi:hypothetical protein
VNVVSLPACRVLAHGSARYRIYAHRYGCIEIERPRDVLSIFFQGNDADRVRGRLALLERHYGGAIPGEALDRLCSDYDHVMSATAA